MNSQNTQIESISEIKPDSINKTIFSESLCKISFKIFTHDADVEILYDPTDNTFNAYALILFNLKNDIKLSDKLTGGKLPLDKLTTGKFPVDKNIDNLNQKLRDKANEKLMNWIRNKDNIDFIDRISLTLTGQCHFLYNDKPIWNEDETINPNILDSKGRVQLNKLTHRDDNIVKIINAGNSPVSGTWLNYEFLPEMLRISSKNYRVLANHYQALLLPKLTLENSSFESEVQQLDKWHHTLYNDYIESFQEIAKEKVPHLKGSATEKLTIKLLNQVFNPHPEEYNNIEHIGQTEKHSCDIRIIDERILVEVKMVKSRPYPENDKFVRDLKENASSVKAGIFINWANDEIQTHIEQNPLRFYINRKDFTIPYLTIIRNTLINENNISNIRDQLTSEYDNQFAHNTETSDKIIQNGTVFYTNILKAILARVKLNSQFKPFINLTDIDEPEKVKQTIQRGDTSELIRNEYITEFIALNFDKFKHGYITEEAKLDYLDYLISKGLYFATDDDASTALKSHLRVDRTTAPRKYKFLKGTENDYSKINVSNIDTSKLVKYEQAVQNGLTTYEQAIKDFTSLPDQQAKIQKPKGFSSENFNLEFKNYVIDIVKPETFGITYLRFMEFYYEYMATNFVQTRKSKKNKWLLPSTDKAKAFLNDFSTFAKTELTLNKNISYEKLSDKYSKIKGNLEYLSKTTTLPLFKQLRDAFIKQATD